MSFQQIVRDIKSLKIQGAENVALSALKALNYVALRSRAKNGILLEKELSKSKSILEETRPTEPFMRNVLKYAFLDVAFHDKRESKEHLLMNIQNAIKHILQGRQHIFEFGKRKIFDNSLVYTHCHSSTVTGILKEAKKEGKRFEVHNTETRPLYQGRKTAKELAKAGIKVTHYVDSAARLALKKADIMVIGADAITSEGKVINKIGSELFAEVAQRYEIPVYVCTNSWKFDSQTVFGFEEPIEKRMEKEVWKNPPKNVTINNFAFEIMSPDVVTGVITELGIFSPQSLMWEINKEYPWMFKG